MGREWILRDFLILSEHYMNMTLADTISDFR